MFMSNMSVQPSTTTTTNNNNNYYYPSSPTSNEYPTYPVQPQSIY